jgi:hypothetical protein
MKSMNPCVALPGACRLSSVTSARQPSGSPRAIHLHRLGVELRVRPVRPELARAAQLERQVPGPESRHPQVARPVVDHLRSARPSATNRSGAAAGGAKMLV